MYRGLNCPYTRRWALGLTVLMFVSGDSASGQQTPSPTDAPQVRNDANLDGVPEEFSPLHPITEQQRHQIEVYKLYSAARALEDQE